MSNLIPTLGLFGAAAFKLVPSIIRIMNNLQKLKYDFPVILTLSEEINSSKRELNIIGKNILDTNETKKSINFSKKIFQLKKIGSNILNHTLTEINCFL
jgi:hypothetical protein